MVNNIKSEVRAFVSQFELSEITLEKLESVIENQGYTIIEFNNISNNENVQALLSALDLQSLAVQSKGFTYADSRHRLVFVHEGLTDDEKLMVLAHEEGHIYCNHLDSRSVIGRDVLEEHEANEFAHYLLHQSGTRKVGNFIRKRKKVVISVVLVAILVLTACIAFGKAKQEKRYYGEFYVTSTGNKYHKKDCIYVRHKNNVERLTIEQFENGEYEPCDVCLPHSSQ